MTKREAERAGNKLLKMMKGKGWKLRVWENIGWHYEAYNPPLSVYSSHVTRNGNQHYHCLMSCDLKEAHFGAGIWSTRGQTSKNPNVVVRKQIKKAREVVDQYMAAVEHAEEIMEMAR